MVFCRLNIILSLLIFLPSAYVGGFGFNNVNIKNQISSFQSNLNKQFQKPLYDETNFKHKIVSILTSLVILLPFNTNNIPAAYASSYSYDLSNEIYKNVNINFPSDDFWYPPFMIGKWNTQFKFSGATFTDKISPELLVNPGHLPGFDKYSVMFIPDIGNDLKDVVLSYVQLDSHPREDHPSNLRALVQASSLSSSSLSSSSSSPMNSNDDLTHIDSAPYYFQKAPDWFHSPANKWKIHYHDSEGSGVVDLYTKKRNIQVFAGAVETFELFHQTHHRTATTPAVAAVAQPSSSSSSSSSSRQSTITYSDYALDWRLAVPAALRDEFIAVEDLSKTNTILGTLDVFVYLQPTSTVYAATSSTPAGVYSYDVVMDRIIDKSTLASSSSSSSSSTKSGSSSSSSTGSSSSSSSSSSKPQMIQVMDGSGVALNSNNDNTNSYNSNNDNKFSNTDQQQQQQQQQRPNSNNNKNTNKNNNMNTRSSSSSSSSVLANIPNSYMNKKYVTGTVTGEGFYDNSGNPVYPFVWRDAGPIDSLKDYFGY